jgi:hypothetical protein
VTGSSAVELFWLPLGAGGWFVRLNGRAYERVAAWARRREPRDLYHSALQVRTPAGGWVVEQAPVHDLRGDQRGVVAEGPVGSRWAGRLRIFRYEIRLWPGGSIPDVREAVDSPQLLSEDERVAGGVLDAVRRVPTPVWGRDEMGAGEMWNSNSVVSWSLATGGIDAEAIEPPRGGRAPGWEAGVRVALRDRSGPQPTRRPSGGR